MGEEKRGVTGEEKLEMKVLGYSRAMVPRTRAAVVLDSSEPRFLNRWTQI